MLSFLDGHSSSRSNFCSRYAVAVSLLLGLLWSGLVSAGQQIIVITSSDSPAYQRAVTALEKQLTESEPITNHTIDYWPLAKARGQGLAEIVKNQSSLIITVGSAAADYAIHQFNGSPIICGFITRNAFDAIRADVPANHSMTAVFMDQPIKRLIQLSTLLRKEQSPYKIGLLSQSLVASQNLAKDEPELVSDIEINTTMLLKNKNPIKQIEPLMRGSDVFIVRPNTSLYNRLVAKLVLQLSMRYKTPVIGFSEKYAKAGALLSLYSSPENIGLDTANMIDEWLQDAHKTMPAPRVGKQFSIVINQRIAQKQGVDLDPKQLKSELLRMEGK